VKWKEGFGVEDHTYERKDSLCNGRWNRRVFFLFAVEVFECGVSCAERSGILDSMFVVARIFVGEQIFKEWVKRVSSFGKIRGGSNY
jgi:hypothetical protein